MYNRTIKPIQTLLGRINRDRATKLPTQRSWRKRSGFGLNEVIGIAITVTVAALIVAPGVQGLAQTAITNMNTWFTSISGDLFATTIT
jgi:hypothetical protein